MNILLDAMGGDNAPDAVIRGAVKASKEISVDALKESIEAQGYKVIG